MLAAIGVSLAWWISRFRRDDRMMLVYVAALAGAFVGAKLVYLGSEGWLHWHESDRWLQLATGKSILGGFLGGYAGVEIGKRLLGYRQPTGDWFAVIVPLALFSGRLGCILHGCCLGRVCEPGWFTVTDPQTGGHRWPAAQTEALFNLIALAGLWWLKSRGLLRHQLFHVYLVFYGLFRFFHEFYRDTPKLAGPVSGYQIAALAVTGLGIVGFIHRQRQLTGMVPENNRGAGSLV